MSPPRLNSWITKMLIQRQKWQSGKEWSKYRIQDQLAHNYNFKLAINVPKKKYIISGHIYLRN